MIRTDFCVFSVSFFLSQLEKDEEKNCRKSFVKVWMHVFIGKKKKPAAKPAK